MRRLAIMVTLILIGALLSTGVSDGVEATYTDPGILTYITAVYALGVAVMLAYTRAWSLIGCGLLATMTGDMLLYGYSIGHVPGMGPWALDIARPCFIVGGTYLVVGLVLWVIRQQRSPSVEMAKDGAP